MATRQARRWARNCPVKHLQKLLELSGFKTVLTTKKDGSDITVMQSKKDPNSVVILMYKKPQAIAVSLKGDFSDIEDWKLGEEE